mmetsp:Transcript_95375/g.269936  ORF Transcript_95375/g.269936 Transcript_95375/m.269936 type:complete len:510 (+) Transcript_95375:67-1596(+)
MPVGDDGAGEGVPMKVEVVAMAMGQGWQVPGADPDDGGPCLNRSHDGPEPQAVEGVYRSSSFDLPNRSLSGSTEYRPRSFDNVERSLTSSTDGYVERSCSTLTNEDGVYQMYSIPTDVSRSSDLNSDFRTRSQGCLQGGGPKAAPPRAELGPPGAAELGAPQRARAPPPGTHDEGSHGMDQQQFNQHVDSYTAEELERFAIRVQDQARLKRQAEDAMKRVYEASHSHPNPMVAGQWPPYPSWPDPSLMGMPYSMPPWHPLYMMPPCNWPSMPAEQGQHPSRRSRRGGSDRQSWRSMNDDAPGGEGVYAMDSNEGDGPDEVPTDQKTTIMLRNIPNNYTRDQVEDLLNKHHFKGKYDFLYLPYDFNKAAGLGYAFINFVTHEFASHAKEVFDNYDQWSVASKKKARVCWGTKFQGQEANIKRYKDSPVMHPQVNDLYKPMCYDEQGNKVSDPLKPEKQPRRPRWKHGPNVSEASFMPAQPSHAMMAEGLAQASELGLVDHSASCLRPDMG